MALSEGFDDASTGASEGRTVTALKTALLMSTTRGGADGGLVEVFEDVSLCWSQQRSVVLQKVSTMKGCPSDCYSVCVHIQ